MNATIRVILEAVRDEKVTRSTRALAKHLLAEEDRREALSAAKACTSAAIAKATIASIEHHEKHRRAEERACEEVSRATWLACCARSRIAHRGALACEACHRHATSGMRVEPHHLEMGSGNRRDAPEVVMVLCPDCHTQDPRSAHRAPRLFVQTIVIPWLTRHVYPLPNRKEYR